MQLQRYCHVYTSGGSAQALDTRGPDIASAMATRLRKPPTSSPRLDAIILQVCHLFVRQLRFGISLRRVECTKLVFACLSIVHMGLLAPNTPTVAQILSLKPAIHGQPALGPTMGLTIAFIHIFLQEQLEREMRECQARYTGICPVRARMYAAAFDELIVAVARDECVGHCHV